MDRGLGLFAGLNVLPKTGWFSSYSSRVTRSMNLSFFKSLHKIWKSTDTSIRHDREPQVVFEVLDFYRKEVSQGEDLKYLVFDNKFTPYENLRKLDDNQITFITKRRRGKNIVEKGISEQIDFFHLNMVSSSMVIKVDFDLTMTIFLHY